jgi:hypothetical protein
MRTDAAGQPAPSAAAGQAGPARKLGRRLARWWSQAPDGRTYQRRRADALVAAAGLGIVVVCGVLVANRTLVGTDVAVFRRINHWPGWLYPPTGTAQLSGVIGALPLVAGAAALLRRLRLAAALAAATLLKVWLEAVAKMFVQRDRPAETLPALPGPGRPKAPSCAPADRSLGQARPGHPSGTGHRAVGAPEPCGRGEVQAFRAVNGLPGTLYVLVWVIMPLGTPGASPAAADAALLAHDRELAGRDATGLGFPVRTRGRGGRPGHGRLPAAERARTRRRGRRDPGPASEQP